MQTSNGNTSNETKDFCDFCAKQHNIVYKEGVADAEYENVRGLESEGRQHKCDGCGYYFEAGEGFLRATVLRRGKL